MGLGDLREPDVVEPVQLPVEVVSFGDLARDVIKQSRGNDRTKRENLRDLETHVMPYLGLRPAAEITRKELKDWRDALLREGYSAKSVSNYRASIVSPVLRAAWMEGDEGQPPLRISNPLLGLPQPAVVVTPPVLLEPPDEVAIFLQCAHRVHPAFGRLVTVKLAGALRFGETVPLKPTALTARQEVQVLDVRRLDEAGSVVVVEDAKTEAGYGRRMPIADVAWQVLEEQAQGVARQDLLLPSPWTGSMWSYSMFHNCIIRTFAGFR